MGFLTLAHFHEYAAHACTEEAAEGQEAYLKRLTWHITLHFGAANLVNGALVGAGFSWYHRKIICGVKIPGHTRVVVTRCRRLGHHRLGDHSGDEAHTKHNLHLSNYLNYIG